MRTNAFGIIVVLACACTHALASESRALYGIHDHDPDPLPYLNHITPAGGGWVTATVAVGHNPATTGGVDFSVIANQGHTIICRINNGYFPSGTIPLPADYDNFARRCSNFVAASTGCNLWVIGNECNLAAEWPFDGTRYTYVSPQQYTVCFRKVYNAIKAIRPNDRVMPAPPAPFAGPYGASTLNGSPSDGNPLNWVQYLNQMLSAIQNTGPLDGIALHITSRGYTYADIHSTNQVTAGGLPLYFSFNVYKDWVDYGIPRSLYHLPLYATECNGYYYWKGGHPENPAAHYEPGWVQEIYAEIDRYNQNAAVSGKPIYRCVNFYRWCASCDGWNIDGTSNPYRAQILSDLDASVAQNHRWPVQRRTTLVAGGSLWKYLDDGSNQGTAWTSRTFNDSTWLSGRGQLGYGDGDEATVINSGPAGNFYITTYFRHSFVVPDRTLYTNLIVSVLRDDGAIVYLNGVEIFRSNMPAGAVANTTVASGTVGGLDELTWYSTNVNRNALLNGTNVLAVEVHQSGPTSSDVSFDLELSALGNLRPQIAISVPQPDAILPLTSNLLISADAVDEDGAVTNVEFFANAVKIGELAAAPFQFQWTNPPEGILTLTAVARDTAGSRTTSAPVNINLQPGLVPAASVWKYLDTGVDQGAAWRAIDFNDASWKSGPAQLGFGDGDEATVIGYGPDAMNKYITTYFRRAFTGRTDVGITNLLLRLLRDDGAVVYLNGTEVFRSNMPNGPISFSTFALNSVPTGPEESTIFFPTNVSPSLLRTGTNLVAVEVHQSAVTSTDLSFDLELLGLRQTPPPALRFSRNDSELELSWSAFAQDFALETSPGLGTTWSSVGVSPVITNQLKQVRLPITDPSRFYRLRGQ